MARSDQDILKDWESGYRQASAFWSPWVSEARIDIQVSMGNGWTAAEERYLKTQRREVMNFNKVRRIIEMIAGHQIKNRLSLKCDPVEGSDTATADILSACLLWIMQSGSVYQEMSDAFRQGPLKTGLNLVELYVDYTTDPLNGDIYGRRIPYNRFLLSQNWTKTDLTDNEFLITRNYLSKNAVKAIIPKDAIKMIDELRPKGKDNKFTDTMPNTNTDNLYRYDRFYELDYEQYKILFDKQTGQSKEWVLSAGRLREVVNMFPGRYEVLEASRPAINLSVIVEDQVVYKGKDQTGAGGYPFVPFVGFYDPEHDEAKWKLQGVARSLRDPSRQENKRICQIIDMIESQIATGWKAKDGSVVNPDALYGSGQGNVVWMKSNAELADAEKLQPPNIPTAVFQIANELGSLMMDVGLVNMEMFGETEGGDVQTSGILSKLRTGAGLTMLQGLFDNFRTSNSLVGRKLINMIQANWKPDKIQRVTGKQPTKEFYNRQFGKYDCVPEEGVLTDTQKQMAYLELKALKAEGAPIPFSAIIEASNVQNKDKLAQYSQKAEEAAAKNEQMQQQVMQMQMTLVASEIERNKADTKQSEANVIDKIGESKASQAQSVLDIIKAVKELQSMDTNQLLEQLKTLQAIASAQNQGVTQ